MRKFCCSYFPLCVLVLISSMKVPCPAQMLWTADGAAVCNAAGTQENPSLVSDGAGGAIVAWANQLTGESFNIFAQRVNANGAPLWPAAGVIISAGAYDQLLPVIAADEAGGAIIAWQDMRSPLGESDVYAQRVNRDGVVQWTADGVAISAASNDQSGPYIVSDGQGGAYIAYRDTRIDTTLGTTDIYLQHVSSNGTIWTNEVAVATSPLQDDRDLAMIGDGVGGAIIVWADGRGYNAVPPTGRDIYAQWVNSSGVLLWGSGGLAVCTASNDQRLPDIASDGAGGAVICWDDKRNGTDFDIYAQRISSTGTLLWTANGAPACVHSGGQVVPTIQSDGSGGAIIAWTDGRAGSSYAAYDIYAQRITATDTPAWTPGGVPVCAAPGWQGRIKSAPDGSGGVFFAWSDNRVDPTNTTYNYDIYGQRFNSSGVAQWIANGIAACAANGKQELQKIVESESGSAIIGWQDTRNDPANKSYDVYAQKVGSSDPPNTTVPTVTDAKSKPDGARVKIQSKVVSAVYAAWFYIEELDRTSGIRVNATGASEGQTVTVTGELATVDGERVLTNATVSSP